jgi:lysophospholipase L1-like esterase
MLKHLLATVVLGPLLLLQGRQVRRVTPVLPEPPGPREGRAGSGPPLRLLILGDSSAAGVGASTQEFALSGRLVAALAPQFDVCWKLVAHTGATTDDLLRTLDTLERAPFDIVVTSLGVNDVTRGLSPRRWVEAQARMLALLRDKFGVRGFLLSAVPPMHLFPALPQPLRGYLGAQALRYNAALRTLAATTGDCTWVPHDLTQTQGQMASDGFHPGPPLYAAWAGQLAEGLMAHWPPRPAAQAGSHRATGVHQVAHRR